MDEVTIERHFVYIIHSHAIGVFYRGYSTNPEARVSQHNKGSSKYTSKTADWALVYIELMHDKRAALIREKSIKKYSKAQIKQLLKSPKNMIARIAD